jgi:hypothetical protein
MGITLAFLRTGDRLTGARDKILSWPLAGLDSVRLSMKIQVIRIVLRICLKAMLDGTLSRDAARERDRERIRTSTTMDLYLINKQAGLLLALALIAAAPIATNAQTTEPPPEPRSCQRLHEETGKCETGMRSCDQHVIARLEAQCQRDQQRLPQRLAPRDGGRP